MAVSASSWIEAEEITAMTSQLRAIVTCGGRAACLAAVAALAGLLGGCNTTTRAVEAVPDDYRLRHPITVQEGARTVEIFAGTSRGSLTPAQRADVLAFAHVWKREATGGVVIDVPSGTPNERAASDVVHEIESILTAAGVPSQGIAVRPYRPLDPVKFATIRLTYPRVTADAGPCGLWPHDLGPADVKEYSENRQYWNFGCAAQRNLAAMVDNPADLVQPRGETPAYTARRSAAIDKYRRGDNPSGTYSGYDAGKISDLGK
jgi:pilus assembly protein CpaD